MALGISVASAEITLNPSSFQDTIDGDYNSNPQNAKFVGTTDHWLGYQANQQAGGFYIIKNSNLANTIILQKNWREGGISTGNFSTIMNIQGIGVRLIQGDSTNFLFKSGTGSGASEAGGTFKIELQNTVLIGHSLFSQANAGEVSNNAQRIGVNSLTLNGNYNADDQEGSGYALYNKTTQSTENGNTTKTGNVLTVHGSANGTYAFFKGDFQNGAKIYGDLIFKDASKSLITTTLTSTPFITGNIFTDRNGYGSTRVHEPITTFRATTTDSQQIFIDGAILMANTTTLNLNLGDKGATLKSSIFVGNTTGRLKIYTTSASSSESIIIDSTSFFQEALNSANAHLTHAKNYGLGIGQAIFNSGTLTIGKAKSNLQDDPTTLTNKSDTSDSLVLDISDKLNNLTVKGKIRNDSGTLTVYATTFDHQSGALVSNDGTITLNTDNYTNNGGIYAKGIIDINSQAGAVNIYGDIKAEWGQDTIDAETATLGKQDQTIALKAYGNQATATASNTLTITNALTAYLSEISVYDNKHNSNGKHQNIITAGTGSTINVGSINASSGSQNSNTITLNGKSKINVSDKISTNGGAINNIKIKGDNTADAYLSANIETTGGNTNIILDRALWLPNSIGNGKVSPSLDLSNTGSVTTTTGGTSTIIYRQGDKNVLSSGVGEFQVNSQGGETNIIMQTGANELHMKSNINYSAGTINLIFARGNNGNSSDVTGGTGSQSESFESGINTTQNTFFGITYQDGVKLTIQDIHTDIGNRENVSILQEYGRYALSDQYLLSVDSDRDRANTQDTVGLSGLVIGSITQLSESTTQKTYNVNLNENSVFIGNIDLNTTLNTINLVMEDKSKMILTSDAISIAKLTVNGATKINTEQFVRDTLDQSENKIINLATGGASSNNVKVRPNFRALGIQTIDGSGSLVFVNYVNQNADQNTATLGGKNNQTRASNAYADRVIIENGGNASAQLTGEYYMQLAFDIGNISAIHYDETKAGAEKDSTNIAVATIAKTTNANKGSGTEQEIRKMGVIALQEANSLQGFDELATTLKAVETQQDGLINSGGSNNYITYFVDSVKTAGANIAVQESTSTIAAASLDIYMANFNSLNKRMGELRDNTNSQGAWGRIFGGQQSSDFGLGSTTGYVTVQAGYDYAFGFEGANNYLGFALAYGYSSSSTNSATNTLSGANEGIEGELKSNMVEVGIYNAYVQDEGWYNDSIFKFSYMMQDFTQSGTASGNSVSTNNFGIILSDEFGYRFKLGDAKEWYIDPQLEVAFGYVNGTEYTQISGLSTLDTKVDALMQLRARFGSSFGYDFKQFTQGKGVDAKLYLGMFYEYDYFNGGDLTLTTNLGGVNSIQSDLSSDGRVVVNVGTNVTVKENTRIYFDFETSFAGKIRTDYQANVGVRYSFGENVGYTPLDPNKKSITPLKVSDENAEESKETQEGVENTQEGTQATTSEQTSDEAKANSAEKSEVKSEEKAQ